MGTHTANAVDVENVRIVHGDDVLVNVPRLQVRAGEHVAVIGRSGAGKSLLAGALTGMVSPTMSMGGTITVAGHRLSRTSAPGALFGKVAFVRQDSADALNPLVTVRGQLSVPLRRRRLNGEGERREAVRLLDSLGLEDPDRILSSYPGELSGGQRQRVCIALALACEPEILIADECTTALDVVSQAKVVDEFRDVGTLIFITHDLAVAADLCDRVVVMDAGEPVEDASVRQVFSDPQHPLTRLLVGELVDAHPGYPVPVADRVVMA